MVKRVLILCTGNSCRSQMAEALWKSVGGSHWQADSAGTNPSGQVHPMAIQAMMLRGLDITSHTSKSAALFEEEVFDLVVTVCDHAKEVCPVFPNAAEQVHWPFEDPADATGSDEQKLDVFNRVRIEIESKITEYLTTDG